MELMANNQLLDNLMIIELLKFVTSWTESSFNLGCGYTMRVFAIRDSWFAIRSKSWKFFVQ